MSPIRIIVLESRNLIREALCAVVEKDTEFRVKGAADWPELLEAIEAGAPDIVIVGQPISVGAPPPESMAQLGRTTPATGILLLQEEVAASVPWSVNQTNVTTFSIYGDGAELRNKIRDMAAMPSESAACLPAHRLTVQEKAILRLISEGRCNKEMSRELGIALPTVKMHVSRMLEKLALADRTQLAIFAIQHGV